MKTTKYLLTLTFLFFLTILSYSQSRTINYQGVVLDNDGSPIANEDITIKIKIPLVNFELVKSVTTSELGAFSLSIPVDGIDFSIADDYQVETTITTTEGTVMSSTPLNYVPFALVADQAKKIEGIDVIDQSPTNEIQSLSIDGNQLTISGGNTVNLPTSGGNGDGDNDPNNEVQQLTVSQSTNNVVLGLTLTGETISFDISDNDADATNEIQTLSVENNALVLSGATGNSSSVSLSTIADGTEDADADPSNELQTISKAGTTVSLSNNGGSFEDAVEDDDANPSNELQTISKVGTTVTLSNNGGSFEDAVEDDDADATNEIQDLSSDTNTPNEVTINISDGGTSTTFSLKDSDADPTNEIQQIMLDGNQLSLTNANTVDLGTLSPWISFPPDFIHYNGYVGINLGNNPGVDYPLHVGGDGKFTGSIMADHLYVGGPVPPGLPGLLETDIVSIGNIVSLNTIRGDGDVHAGNDIAANNDVIAAQNIKSFFGDIQAMEGDIVANGGHVIAGKGIEVGDVSGLVTYSNIASHDLLVEDEIISGGPISTMDNLFADHNVIIGDNSNLNNPVGESDLLVEGNVVAGNDVRCNGALIVGNGSATVGLTGENGTLNVENDITMGGDLICNGGVLVLGSTNMGDDGNGSLYLTTQNLYPSTQGQNIGGNTAFHRWNNIYANAFVTPSDRRLKKNIHPLVSSLASILAMNPVSYQYKNSEGMGDSYRLGFLAQELKKVIPQAVIGEEGINTYLGVKYTELIPVTVKAIQEQQAMIDVLKNQILEMKQEIKELRILKKQ